jgi:ribosome-associated protein
VTALDPDTAQLLSVIHQAASEKLAQEPVALNLRGLTTMTDALYVCHADSGRAMDAVADHLIAELRKVGEKALHVEGLGGQQWVLIDLGSIMVHVFMNERREFYGLEKLWADAEQLELPEVAA